MGESRKERESTGERDERGCFLPGHPKTPGGGRPEGSINRYTRLRNAILDGIELAAKEGGKENSAQWVAECCKRDALRVLAIAAGLLPKEFKGDVEFTLAQALLYCAKRRNGESGGP